MLAGAASACSSLRAGLRRLQIALATAPYPPCAIALHCNCAFQSARCTATRGFLRSGATCCLSLADSITTGGTARACSEGGVLACTRNGGAITRKSMSDGICSACLLCATKTSGCGAGACALRRALRRARLLCNDCGGNTVGETNGGRGLASRDSGSARARFRDVANSLAC